jgi:predicted phosphodiesterase
VIDISGLKIGILGINSAIFSSGDQDHGKLWIGRRCLDIALQKMASFEPDLRIALLHHPTDWLHDEERSNIRNKFKANIDFILRGHLHENEAETIVGSDSSTLFIAAGASYQTRKYPNTALFVQVKYDERRVRIFPIHYIDRPREIWTVDPSLFPDEETFEGDFSFQPPPSALLKNQTIAVTEEARSFPKGVEKTDDIPPAVDIDQKFYLVHSSEIVKEPEKNQPGLFRIRVWLEANRVSDLNLCQRVTYQLHETFDPNIIATKARQKDFEVWLNAFGEFLVLAFVKLKDGSGYWISRYLELPGRPPD